MINFKPGVKTSVALCPQILSILPLIDDVFRRFGMAFVTITSAIDGKHMSGSKHYTGEAIDLRTRDLSVAQRDDVHGALVTGLDTDFDVVLEATHIHVEWDPKKT